MNLAYVIYLFYTKSSKKAQSVNELKRISELEYKEIETDKYTYMEPSS